MSSSGDKPRVREIYKKLCSDRFEPWLDEKDLLPGQNWELEIPQAMRNSDVIIVCLSRSSISKSGYVQREIKLARDVEAEQPEGTIFLIPLKLEDCELPEQLKRWYWVNFYEEDGYERLRKALQYRAATLKKNMQLSADIENHSTLSSKKIPEPNNSDNQLFEQGLKAYLLASPTAPWIFIGALLILLFVAIFLRPPSDHFSSAIPPNPSIEIQPEGIEIRNQNDYPIVNLEVYLITYKFDKVRRKITYNSLNFPNMVLKDLAPQQATNVIPLIGLTQFGTPPNSDEIIIWALVITFRREIDQNNFVEVEPFSVSTGIYGQSVLYTLRLPYTSYIVEKIERCEKNRFRMSLVNQRL